jgi:ectoine hydroxylase-related dioxygenase (phytanoyl-CoA dioxygenase family)
MSTIDRASIEFFKEHGYLILKDIIPEEAIDDLREFLSGSVNRALDIVYDELGERIVDVPSLVGALNEKGKLAEVSQATKSILTGHFPLEIRLSEQLWKIPRENSFRSMLSGLIDSQQLYMHMPPAARFVLPGNSHAGVPAHQDIAYGSHMSDFITVWVPLVNIDNECGGLAVFDRSHLRPVQAVKSDDPFWLPPVSTDGRSRIECMLNAGDALVMNKYLIHESIGNRSNRIRLSIDYRFFGGAHKSSKHYLDLQSWNVVPPS